MKDSVTMAIPSHPKYLSMVRDVVVRMAAMNGVSDKTTEELKLAVDEACSNVIKHAYHGNTGRKIVVTFNVTPKKFMVVIEDDGIKADQASVEGRSLTDVRPGGLGVHFIRKTFDVFEFDQKKRRGNRLSLIRYLEDKHENRVD